MSMPATAELFVHQLKHQLAAKVIPVIQPHLSTQTSMTAKDYQLFVNGTKKDNQKVIDILQMVDTKTREYLVEVKILDQEMNRHEQNISKAELNKQSSNASIRRFQTQSNQKANSNFSIRTIENYQALISTGESFPNNQINSQYGHLLPSNGRTNIKSGFYIAVQQTGATTVSLSVSAQQQSRQTTNNRSVNASTASTKISGELGKWIFIASNASKSSLRSTKRYTTDSRASKTRWYYVRVTSID